MSSVRVFESSSRERRLVRLVCAVVFLDTLFYAVLAPLLPSLAGELHLSKLSAGVLTASYPLGTLIGSLPGGLLVARIGPRQTLVAGLVLLALSTVAFGLLHNVVLLDLTRVVEGFGGACSWAGGLAWIVVEAPAERRGGLMGKALGMAIAGALFGPVLGVVASSVGRPAAFGAVGLVALWLAAEAMGMHSSAGGSEQGVQHFAAALRNPRIVGAMWLVALPAMVSGAINVLAPLRLHRLGAGALAVGATFLIATAIEALITPAIGRLSDRRGRLLPLRLGLVASAVVCACFPLPDEVWLVGLSVVATMAALAAFWAPAMAMLSDEADASGLDQGLAAAMMNMAWAGGQILGAGVGGAVAKAAGDAVPVAFGAALCLATFVALTARVRAPSDLRRASRPVRG